MTPALIPTLPAYNGEPSARKDIPVWPMNQFRTAVIRGVQRGLRLVALPALPKGAGLELLAVLADDHQGVLHLLATAVDKEYPALTPECPAAHCFERELAEQWGLRPEGHPWLKPIRFQAPNPAALPAGAVEPGVMDYFRVEGSGVHEVAVGPVHAGIIEPGHFRFQCHGEEVLHLEISLGYQHRGLEAAFRGGPHPQTLRQMEIIAGDTTIAHATAYARVVEHLAGQPVPPRAQFLRAIALELERLANHAGDLGALAGDVGFLPTAAWCGRLRGDFLNLTALLCGSRFGRGLVVPGGVQFDLDDALRLELLGRLKAAARDADNALDVLFDSPSVQARFEDTGHVSHEQCRRVGLVGPAARACAVDHDGRRDFPFGLYRFVQIPVSTCDSGDVFARAMVRRLEIRRSVDFIAEQLNSLPGGDIRTPQPATLALAPDQLVVALVEGWRGEVCHVAATDDAGRFALYKPIDPSFHNWAGLALCLRGQQISDFPLCNKSFNLSYCGHDL